MCCILRKCKPEHTSKKCAGWEGVGCQHRAFPSAYHVLGWAGIHPTFPSMDQTRVACCAGKMVKSSALWLVLALNILGPAFCSPGPAMAPAAVSSLDMNMPTADGLGALATTQCIAGSCSPQCGASTCQCCGTLLPSLRSFSWCFRNAACHGPSGHACRSIPIRIERHRPCRHASSCARWYAGRDDCRSVPSVYAWQVPRVQYSCDRVANVLQKTRVL